MQTFGRCSLKEGKVLRDDRKVGGRFIKEGLQGWRKLEQGGIARLEEGGTRRDCKVGARRDNVVE